MIRAAHQPAPRPRTGGALVGCLVALAILLIIIVIGAVYVGLHWKGWTAAAMQQVSTKLVQDSGLPQDQRDQIIAEVQKLTDGFQAGTVSLQQMKNVGDEIAQSPLLHLGALQLAKQKYIEPSTMTPDEKAAATRSLQRFARGVYERKIPKEAIDDVIKPVTTLKPDGRWELNAKPTRTELDQFVSNAKQRADDAKIPDEPFDLNIADELKKAIEKALNKTP